MSPLLLWSLLACAPVQVPTADRDGAAPTVGADGDSDGADGASDGADGTDAVEGTDTPPSSAVFQLDHVVQIDLRISDDGVASLQAEPRAYVSADVTIDGAAFPHVGVRSKGRLGSARPLPGKSGFKIDLLEFGEDARLEGLEKLNLNNMVQDCAKVKELAAYGVHALLGTPAPRVAYATLTLNGAPYGLYTLVEAYDDEFLKAHFDDPTGNLYDGDYFWYADGSYTLVDFVPGSQDLFELDEGADVGLADVHAVTEARQQGGDFVDTVGGLIDLEQHARFWAATAWTGQYDSYPYYANNYRVYFDPSDGGRGVFMPWDPDWAFYADTPLSSPYGTLTAGCAADVRCREWFGDALDTLAVAIPESDLPDRIDQAVALIGPELDADPHLEHSRSDIARCQAEVQTWLVTRSDALAAAGL
jgi:hypothetical protein